MIRENGSIILATQCIPIGISFLYEDFIRNAPDIIADWAAAFDLPAIDAMRRGAKRPSLST